MFLLMKNYLRERKFCEFFWFLEIVFRGRVGFSNTGCFVFFVKFYFWDYLQKLLVRIVHIHAKFVLALKKNCYRKQFDDVGSSL